MRLLITTAAALALAASPGLAQPGASSPATTGGSATSGDQSLSQQDKDFLKDAANGKAEVEAGRYVQEHAASPAVRVFGRWMVTDHTMAGDALQRTAASVGYQLPGSLDREARGMVDQVKKLRGAELDRTYIGYMVEDHRQDVRAFEKEAQSGQNPQVKAFAQEYLPVLQQHLTAIEELRRSVIETSARGTIERR